MTTYTKTPFDWNKALDDAIAEPEKADWLDLENRASDWVTCATGCQCDAIPRFPDGAPLDTALRRLGMQFCDEILEEDYPAAKHTLSLIEARSAELLKNL